MYRHPHWGHPDHDACGTGFVARLGGPPTHEIVELALQALDRLSHRGGVDADGASGDGAGLLTAIPDEFFRARAAEEGIVLPEQYGLGVLFVPPAREKWARESVEMAAAEERLRFLGWRVVPTQGDAVGSKALGTMPRILQFFIGGTEGAAGTRLFEARLALLRKRAETLVPDGAYFCSLSSRSVVYKGLLTPGQFPRFYSDLRDTSFETTFAIFHQRYSTNTQPSWHLAQPFRHIAHNGEINTIVANRRWLRAQEPDIRAQLGVDSWFRALEPNVSDSASLDNGFELELLLGQSPEKALLRMVPPAFANDPELPAAERAALESLCEAEAPWDGPAALIFSDGEYVGAKLDRNGLRPLRYLRTRDGLVIAGSEAGLLDVPEARIAERGRLGPGEMLLVQPVAGEIFHWAEVLERVAASVPESKAAPPRRLQAVDAAAEAPEEPQRLAAALGWTEDQFRILFSALPKGKEADWSMGDDAPPAFLSSLPRPLWDYCKQRFAQVTNPPIDPLREAHVMSLDLNLGGKVVLRSPLLGSSQMAELAALIGPVQRIDFTFPVVDGVSGARRALLTLAATPAGAGARPGLILLSDRGAGRERGALPALLATAAVWKAMVAAKMWDVPLVVETGQAFDTHHVALLVAAGACAVHPYLALHFAESIMPGGVAAMRRAVDAGLRKVLSRMGISTLASYRNSHLFEIIGLEEAACAEYFEDAASYLGRKRLDDVLGDYLRMHSAAYAGETAALPDAGLYRFRKAGERHATSPDVVRRMHAFIKSPDAANYEAYEKLGIRAEPVSVRDMLGLVPGQPVPLEEVESEHSILRRFSTQAMSLGSLSPEAHRTLALAMNQLGARSNTGEGGEDPSLYSREPAATNKIKQVASGRFGVTAEYLVNAEELEIKMAQGSKPGEGGQLPAHKVTAYIARIRHAVPGTPLISPPPHHDIYSIEDLAQLIYDLRAINPRARIGVKLVSGTGVGIIAAGVAKAGANVVTISGHDGGTGSSPLTSIKNTGLPWELGLRNAHEALTRTGLRSRVTLRVDGGLKFARDVVLAAILGADEFGFGTAALLAVGCVMARQCHLNTCPVGIATQDETLRARFEGKPEMIVSYFRALAHEVREWLARLGVRSLNDLVGDETKLRARVAEDARWLKPFLTAPPRSASGRVECAPRMVPDGYDIVWHPGTAAGGRSSVLTLRNAHRTIGARWTGEFVKRHSGGQAADEKHEAAFRGTAGQSFGAFLVSGITLRLTGEANDYVGKGLCGGTIAVTAGARASRRGDVLIGNTVLYGATSGQLFVAGRAGERFAVRNSGALAVVEGAGQHACEYMTAGVAVILGSTGFNFGAGMTGGLAYLASEADHGLNREFVTIVPPSSEEEEWLRLVLQEHVRLTGSPRAAKLLAQKGPLPVWRVQPVQLPCAVEVTWKPILAQLRSEAPVSAPEGVSVISQTVIGA
jgi:glutamate synthase (ferredoxin)